MAALLVGAREVVGSIPGVRVLDGAPLQQCWIVTIPSSADIVVAGQMAALVLGTREVDGSSPAVLFLDGAPL